MIAPDIDALDPWLRQMARLLVAAEGRFVNGHALAKAAARPFDQLSYAITRLRRALPDFTVEGKKGSGYRLVARAPREAVSQPGKAGPVFSGVSAGSGHYLTNQTKDRLAQFVGPLVEQIASTALENGETLEKATSRLVFYGLAVDRDLRAEGVRP